MTNDEENAIFDRLMELVSSFQLVKADDARAVALARRDVLLLRQDIARIPWDGTISVKKIVVECPAHLGEDFAGDWSAMIGTMRQHGWRI